VVIDASAIVAILTGEPEAQAFDGLIATAIGERCTTVIALYEAGLAIARKAADRQIDVESPLRTWVADAGIAVRPIGVELLTIALEAHRRYGKGSGSGAQLNMGDCFAYAAAAQLGLPLLFKGDDFSKTDVVRASA
jgi:ribonuclease VapC